MKKIWKDNAKLILAIFITIVIASGATYAATTMYDSNIVGYDNTTSGGYVGSKMYTATLPSVLTTYINPVFSGHVLSYDTLLTKQVCSVASNGYAGWTGASCDWDGYTRQLDLMNEVQVTSNTAVSSSMFDVGTGNIQFPLFRLRPEFKFAYNSTTHSASSRSWYWLRSVQTDVSFAAIASESGCVGQGAVATLSFGVRPYFFIG